MQDAEKGGGRNGDDDKKKEKKKSDTNRKGRKLVCFYLFLMPMSRRPSRTTPVSDASNAAPSVMGFRRDANSVYLYETYSEWLVWANPN